MMKKLFIVVPLGLEELASQELSEVWPYLIEKEGRPHAEPLQMEVVKGGIEVTCSEILGYQLNFFLKIPSRILLRLSEFKAKDFSKFQRKLSEIPLQTFLGQKSFDVEISASESKLLNEKKVLEIVRAVWKKQMNPDSNLKIYIRIYQDECSISLDTTGTHLHFRSGNENEAVLKTLAPLRETFAAALMLKMMEGHSLAEANRTTLVDPMSGSGTLAKEGQLLYQPHFDRAYSFQEFSNCPKILKSDLLKNNYPKFPRTFQRLILRDKLSEVQSAVEANLKTISHEFQVEDLFQAKPINLNPCWVVLNPPYGERLDVNFQFSDLPDQIEKTYSPLQMGILVPLKQIKNLPKKTEGGLEMYKALEFSNNGIGVVFVLYK